MDFATAKPTATDDALAHPLLAPETRRGHILIHRDVSMCYL